MFDGFMLSHTISGDTKKTLALARKRVKELAANTPFSAREITDMMIQLLRVSPSLSLENLCDGAVKTLEYLRQGRLGKTKTLDYSDMQDYSAMAVVQNNHWTVLPLKPEPVSAPVAKPDPVTLLDSARVRRVNIRK